MDSKFAGWMLQLRGCIILLVLASTPFSATDFSAAQADERVKPNMVTEGQLELLPNTDSSITSFDFRKANWGMTKEQVKKAETGKLEGEQDDHLTYSDHVAGKNVKITYTFRNHVLVRCSYMFKEEHTNKNLFISDYEEIKRILSDRYGPPSAEHVNWANHIYRDDPAKWGIAVSLGHLSYLSFWDTNTTKLYHVLLGNDHKIALGTTYESKELERESEKDKIFSDFSSN